MSPRNATTAKSGQRFYSWRGERYWSVTTILSGGIPKPVLVNWAKKYTAEYAVNNIEALVKLCETDTDGAIDWLKGAAYRERDRAADLGSHVHAATEAYVLKQPFPAWPDNVKPRMDSFIAYLDKYEPTYEATEASVYNRTQRYAGTLDAIATINGKRVLLDLKTSKGVYPEVALQLAAYRHAEFIGLPDGSEEAMRPVDACACLHITDDGFDLVEVQADPAVFNFFLYAREIFRWQQEQSKKVLLGTYPATLEGAGIASEEVAA